MRADLSALPAGPEEPVTPHTRRHTAAPWLRQQTGDALLVAAYLGHADLSTCGCRKLNSVSRS